MTSDSHDFLERSLAGLPKPIRSQVLKRIVSGDASQIDASIYELAAYEFLKLLDLSPEMNPLMETGQTPDLALTIDGQQFIADVFVTHSPQASYKDFPDGSGSATDSGERARKIAGRLSEKSTKYAGIGLPLLQLVFLGDHRILSLKNVEVALYGVALSEFVSDDSYSGSFHFERRNGGILLPDRGVIPHTQLSAVIAVDWFDSLSRERPGRRFACHALNHIQPAVQIKRGAFHPFQETHWRSSGENAWQPDQIGDPSIVARCGTELAIEFGRYTSDCPW